MLTRKMFVLGCAALLGALGAAALPARAADDVKKAAAVKAKRDKFRADLKTKGKMPFLDLSYAADPKAAGEPSRWSQSDPPHPEATEEKGTQFSASFSLDITKGTAITVRVHKLIHKDTAKKLEFTYKFEHAGMEPKCAEKDKILEGFWKDSKMSMKDVTAEQKPKDKKCGPAETYASVTGVAPESNVKERRDWYVWTGPNITWVAAVTFDSKFIGNDDIMVKAEEFIKTIKELKAPD